MAQYDEKEMQQLSANYLQGRLDNLTDTYARNLKGQPPKMNLTLFCRHWDSRIEHLKKELAQLAEQGIKPIPIVPEPTY